MAHMDNRRGGRAHNRRDDILAAAMEMFAERGYRGTSLAAVADRIGLTQQGVLHYFPSKQALLVEVLRRRDTQDRSRLSSAGSYLDSITERAADNAGRPGVVRSFTVLSAESVTEGHPATGYFRDRYASTRAFLAARLAQELDQPVAGRLTAAQAAALVIAVMDGLQLQWLLDPGEIDLVSLVSAFVDLLRGANGAGSAADNPQTPDEAAGDVVARGGDAGADPD
jgi:AcrR family transcriptional regulator